MFDVSGTCSDQFSTTVIVDPVGVTELNVQRLALYPNPADQQVTIEANTALGQLTVYDLTGRIVYAEQGIAAERTRLNVAQWQAGVYLVETAGTRVRLVVK